MTTNSTTQSEGAMEYAEATKLLRDYCCSTCWSSLIMVSVPDQEHRYFYKAHCATHPDHPETYVTKKYAERARANSVGDALEVHANLIDAGVLPKRSEQDILKDLGF